MLASALESNCGLIMTEDMNTILNLKTGGKYTTHYVYEIVD